LSCPVWLLSTLLCHVVVVDHEFSLLPFWYLPRKSHCKLARIRFTAACNVHCSLAMLLINVMPTITQTCRLFRGPCVGMSFISAAIATSQFRTPCDSLCLCGDVCFRIVRGARRHFRALSMDPGPKRFFYELAYCVHVHLDVALSLSCDAVWTPDWIYS
jgi:hypothetical protein